MSRSKEVKVDFSDSDSEQDNFKNKTAYNNKVSSIIKSNKTKSSMKSTDHSIEKKEKNVRLKTGLSSDENEDEKLSKKNNVESDKTVKERKSRNKQNVNSDSSRSRSRSSTLSTERYKPIDKHNKQDLNIKPLSKKVEHFSRPRDRKQSPSSDSSNSDSETKNKKKPTNKPEYKNNSNNKNGKNKGVSRSSNSSSPSFSETTNIKKNTNSKTNHSDDSDSSLIKNKQVSKSNKNNNKNEFMKSQQFSDKEDDDKNRSKSSFGGKKVSQENSTTKKHILSDSSSDSDDSTSSSTSNTSTETRTLSKSEDDQSTERENRKNRNDRDDYSENEDQNPDIPIRVNIGRKPPIDISGIGKKKSNLEKSKSSENDYYTTSSNKIDKKNIRGLNETFDIESNNSSNEMTDVSPLPSPHKSTNSKRRSSLNNKSNKEEKDEEKFDMTIFYKALNKDFDKKLDNVFKLSRTSSANNISNSANQSYDHFDNYNNKYDLKNKLLFEKLAKATLEKDRKPKQIDRPFRITSSALNRQRDQQRIERENQVLLKRLLKVKASKYLNKDEQLKDYEKNFGMGTVMCSRPTTSQLNYSSMYSDIGNRSNLSTKRSSAKSSLNVSRVSSAKSTKRGQFSLADFDPSELFKRTNSASRQRPEWTDRW